MNLHCFKLDGTEYPSNDARFAAIAATVATEHVQAIAVQEACENETEGIAMERLAAALQTATGERWGHAWTPTHMAWTGTSDEAQEGVGLLTRGAEPANVSVFEYSVQGSQERWLIAGDFVLSKGTVLRLVSVHLEHDQEAARLSQARQSGQYVLVQPDILLLAGDFNARADEQPIQDLEAAGLVRLSAAADHGGEIDHLFAPMTGGVEVVEARMGFTGDQEPPVSDHPGLFVHFRMGTKADVTQTHFTATGINATLLTVRGDTTPLSWESGWPGIPTESDRWEAAFLGWPSGTVAYKWLKNDTDWETGDNHQATVGTDSAVTPEF